MYFFRKSEPLLCHYFLFFQTFTKQATLVIDIEVADVIDLISDHH